MVRTQHHIARVAQTPIGDLMLVAGPDGLVAVEFIAGRNEDAVRRELSARLEHVIIDGRNGLLSRGARELNAYLRRERRAFSVPMSFGDTASPFQRRVWRTLLAVPYGATTTYTELAQAIGAPCAARAVGNACASNPLPIIVPCHRVITSDGRLGGYLGGLPMKRRLLSLERASARDLPLFAVAPAPESTATGGLSDRLQRWLSGSRRPASVTADRWLQDVLEEAATTMWPEVAEQVIIHQPPNADAIVEGLLEAWSHAHRQGWPDGPAAAHFMNVAGRRGSHYFELMGRRWLAMGLAPHGVRESLERCYQRLMEAPDGLPPRTRRLAVDFWMALDPAHHTELLRRASRRLYDLENGSE